MKKTIAAVNKAPRQPFQRTNLLEMPKKVASSVSDTPPAPPVAEIPQEMSGLSRSLDALGDVMGSLAQRLQPILYPESPQDAGDCEAACGTDLGAFLRCKTNEVRTITDLVNRLHDRLALT